MVQWLSEKYSRGDPLTLRGKLNANAKLYVCTNKVKSSSEVDVLWQLLM